MYIIKRPIMLRCLLGLLGSLAILPAWAARQDMSQLEQMARYFVQGELSQRPQARFRLGHLDRHLAVAACPSPQIAWADGAVPMGSAFLDLYCLSPDWRLRLAVSIEEGSQALVLTRAMRPGDSLTTDDVRLVPVPQQMSTRDLLTDPAQVLGQAMTGGAAAGVWLRAYMVRPPFVVKMNQRVRVMIVGEGFSVAAEGVALGNGRAGDVVAIRMSNNQILRGTAAADGTISLAN